MITHYHYLRYNYVNTPHYMFQNSKQIYKRTPKIKLKKNIFENNIIFSIQIILFIFYYHYMKKALFKWEYTLQKDYLKEAFIWSLKKAIRLITCFAILLTLLNWLIIWYNDIHRLLWNLFFNLILFYVLLIIISLITYKRQCELIKTQYHKDSISSEITFNEDEFIVYNPETKWTNKFYYNQLKRVFETKNLYVASIWKYNNIIYITKKSLSIWDSKQFLDFLKSKIKESKKSTPKK